MEWILRSERMPEEKAYHEDGRNYADKKDRDWTESERVLVVDDSLHYYTDWEAPMIVDEEDWFTEEWLNGLRDFGKIKKVLAIGFMNFLDDNRPEGKMCLSNGECADIEKAVKEQDWPKLAMYLNKYIRSKLGC